jgi:hypothetical protein
MTASDAADAPFFDDTSPAGYDRAAHGAFVFACLACRLDPDDPDDRAAAAVRLTTWLDKLNRHDRPLRTTPTQTQPF